MKRWWGWWMAAGLGGMLAAGCVAREQEESSQVGRPHTPIQQKYKSPAASAAESGQGGSGEEGLAMPDGWQEHPASEDDPQWDDEGPFQIGRPQAVPRERRPAPLGVGSGVDSARTMAKEQLKSTPAPGTH